MAMRVALYVRVSTQRQAQAQTVEQQVERLAGHARQQGWDVPPDQIVRDDGYSGASLRRPGLDRLRDRAAARSLDLILITAPDRLARNYVHQVLLLEELQGWTSSLGVEGSLTNPDTPGGQDGGEEDPAAVHRRVQGRGGQAAAGGRQRTDRGRDRAGAEPRAAERVAQRAPGGRLGGGAGRPQGRAGRDPAAQA